MRFRRLMLGANLWCALLLAMAPSTTRAALTYGFDDGTFEGWELITPLGEPLPDDGDIAWVPSNATIDIGDGFTLLTATSGDYRVVPDPFENRDCIGLFCYTTILRSPEFFLDGSGDLSIDMIGGGAQSNRPFDPDIDEAPSDPEFFVDTRDGSGLQGFALLDVEAGMYVLHGFSTGENDGKARPEDPPTRADWETVTLPQSELEPYANDGKAYRIDIFDSYTGGWGWIGFDTVRVPGRTDASVVGDFNSNGVLDGPDIDDLTQQSAGGTNPSSYDLNNDALVNAQDIEVWINDLFSSWVGDANLDGQFGSSDLVTVLSSGTYESGEAAVWSTGDFDGNGLANSTDLVAALAGGGYEQGPRASTAAVPEPMAFSLFTLGSLIAVLQACRVRRQASG